VETESPILRQTLRVSPCENVSEVEARLKLSDPDDQVKPDGYEKGTERIVIIAVDGLTPLKESVRINDRTEDEPIRLKGAGNMDVTEGLIRSTKNLPLTGEKRVFPLLSLAAVRLKLMVSPCA
jgi:hypothetical protein